MGEGGGVHQGLDFFEVVFAGAPEDVVEFEFVAAEVVDFFNGGGAGGAAEGGFLGVVVLLDGGGDGDDGG